MFNPKVSQPNMSNNIPQMRSNDLQPPFISGGNQVGYYLGIKGNNQTSQVPQSSHYSTYEKLINKHISKK